LQPDVCQGVSASEMTCIVSSGALNSTHSHCHILRLNAPNSILAGAPPRTLNLGELTALRRSHSWI